MQGQSGRVAEQQGSPEGASRLDDLRRRLYRADATDADVQRYEAERALVAEDAPDPPAEPVAPPATPRHRAVLLLGATAVAGIALLAAVRTGQPAVEAGPASASPSAGRSLVQDVGEGQVLAVELGSVSDPMSVPVSIRGTAVAGQRFLGRGNAVVAFHPPGAVTDGGRAMVVLTANGPSPVGWRALLTMTRNETTTYPIVMARGQNQQGAGLATPTTFVFPGSPPTRIAVEAPSDVRWTLVVGATDGLEPELR